MDGGLYFTARKESSISSLNFPLMPGGYQSGMTKSKAYRGCVGIALFKSEEGN